MVALADDFRTFDLMAIEGVRLSPNTFLHPSGPTRFQGHSCRFPITIEPAPRPGLKFDWHYFLLDNLHM
jgi:hypothetical protein